MSAAPELRSVQPAQTAPQTGASRQEQHLITGQRKSIDAAAASATASTSTPVVLSTENVMKNLPVSMAVSLSEISSTHHHSATSTANFPSELVVVKSSMSGQVVSSSESETRTKVQYNLSEAVMKEREALFKSGEDSSVESTFVLEPPRSDTQTVRMRSKNFFALMEEEEGEEGADKSAQQTPNQDPSLASPAGTHIKYTPIFNFGQSLHQVFHSQKKRKQRPNSAPKAVDESGDKAAADPDTQEAVYSRVTCGYESDPEHFVQLYEKITMNQNALRRNSSQPNLVKSCVDESSEFESGQRLGVSQSQSMPNTPKVSPKLNRRGSATAADIIKPEKLKPDATGPGLSFLASVAGELRAHKKTQPNKVNLDKVLKDGQIARASTNSPDIHVYKPSTDTNTQINTSIHDSTVTKYATSEKMILKKPERGQLFKKTDKGFRSSTESSPSTSPKRTNPLTEMSAAGMTHTETTTKRSSFMKSIVDWSTTPQVASVSVSNKEHNMYGPTSH